MGDRQQARSAVEKALAKLFPDEANRTSAETSLINDVHSLTAKNNLDASELRVLARVIAGIKTIIDAREISN